MSTLPPESKALAEHHNMVPNIQPHDGYAFAAIKIPHGLYGGAGAGATPSRLAPQEIYDGGYGGGAEIRVRIANGGAGQSGLIGAWANAFIKYSVEVKHSKPFRVAWYLGDTTESLGLIQTGSVDIAVTYNSAAELQSLNTGASSVRKYGFRDHFMLVGPKSNPAQLSKTNDDILAMFNKIVTRGNEDVAVPPKDTAATRFLSRYDKSATNIKESELFVTIGQVPWGLVYSKWYHQYPRFPLQALNAASVLDEYTITDFGTWLSSPSSVTSTLDIYKIGSDNANDLLLNPAHVLLSSTKSAYITDCENFMTWVVDTNGGQKVIREFTKKDATGKEVQLYSEAP